MLYQISLFADIDTVPNMCIANNFLLRVCKTQQFWETKFQHDNIKFNVVSSGCSTVNNWIQSYKKNQNINYQNAIKISHKLIHYMLDKKKHYFNYISIVDNYVI